MDLLEREHCLAMLERTSREARRHGGRIALVGGEAGIGKTSLLQAFAKGSGGARVLWGACDALFTPRPLAPLHDVARQTQGALQTSLASGRSREALFDAMLDEMEATPSIVVFEDLHWADEATLDLIKFLGRRIQRTASLLILSYRADEVGPRHPLQFVIGDLPRAQIVRIELAALSEASVAHLAHLAGRPSLRLHSITGGNPLFVTEVLAAPVDSVPASVREAVLARVSRLAAPAREIAELVSVVPNRAESWLIERAVGAGAAEVEACLGVGLVLYEDGALGFRHELTRLALQDSLSQTHRERLHARVLAALQQRSDVAAARLAHHADGARHAAEAARYAQEAAIHAVSVGAHREAASHYRTVLRYSIDLPAHERARVHECLAYECYLTDQGDEAIAARTTAMSIWCALGSQLQVGDSLRWLSRLTWFAGRRADAMRFGIEAVATLEALPPGRELAMAYSNRSQLAMLAHDSAGAIEWGGRAIALAQGMADEETLAHALNNVGTGRLVGGNAAGWLELERSLSIALANDWQEHVARAYTNLATMSVACRNYVQAERHFAAGIAYSEQRDLDSWRLYMLAWRARSRFERCEWQGAGDDAELVLQHPRICAVSRAPALIVLGHLRLRRGDPEALPPLQEAGVLAWQIDELQRSVPLALARAEAAWLAGDMKGIVTFVRPVFEAARHCNDPWMLGELAVWLHRANALDASPDAMAPPFSLEMAGEHAAASRAWRALGCDYDGALALAHSAKDADRREALVIFDALGGRPAAQALRQRMRSAGIRHIPRGARASTRTHPLRLTKREAQIFALLSSGLRNAAIAKRLFLSTKTVDRHVSAILMKLGVPSRAGAIALAHRTQRNQPAI